MDVFKNLSDITSQIGNLGQQISTVSKQHLMLSNQIHLTGRALNSKIHLDAGRAATIEIQCKNPVLRKHQKDIENHMEPDSELLAEFFSEGIIIQMREELLKVRRKY